MNFSHGDHESHLEVLNRFRSAAASRGSYAACLLDTKGPEIRTAMLAGGKPIQLMQGQSIVIEAVGDAYTTFEGYSTDQETRIGLSYARLAQTVTPGGKILLADGTISIEVTEIISDTEVRGTVQNTKSLGQRKNCNLPGVKVDLPVLMDKDVDDLQNFACKHKVDFVAASFVQSKDDVLCIRKVLDEAGGQDIGIISKIENQEGLQNYDEILEVTDGMLLNSTVAVALRTCGYSIASSAAWSVPQGLCRCCSCRLKHHAVLSLPSQADLGHLKTAHEDRPCSNGVLLTFQPCAGVMVARGDLGMEIPVEKVPLAQKMMIAKANVCP